MLHPQRWFFVSLFLASILLPNISVAEVDAKPLQILFLGDRGLHRPADRAGQLIPVMRERGIRIEYTEDPGALNAETLNAFDGLLLYANIEELSPDQEASLMEYVASGHGFIALHCATACFANSAKFIELVGAQFKTHEAQTFRTEVGDAHPLIAGYGGFSSWDETYVHHRHNDDRSVVEYRVQGIQAEGRQREPWSWVRQHGQGRVFYTAWGHDQRTWRHPGFQNLVERGIRWACGSDLDGVEKFPTREAFVLPPATAQRNDCQPFEYIEVGAKIPNYQPGSITSLTTMQQPLSSAESIKHFVTPQGFEVQRYTGDPDLPGKPITMTWDARGRLWVCETYDYPNELQPVGQGRDRIRICEDTDGDGRADHFTVFADRLSIPSAMVHYRGGLIVQNATETIFLKDVDGDDKADVRTTLISGWTLPDTHGGVSNFQYGHDNWIWGMQGYNHSTPTVNGKEFQSFRMGFFRFKLDAQDPPNVTEVEFIRSTNNNTWGLGFSEEGIVFGSTANMHPSLYMPIANRYYERVRGWSPELISSMADTHLFHPITDKVRQVDVHGGYTAGAGHALYTARHYPQSWWNRTAFVCGPTGHLVGTFVIEEVGADFQSTSPGNLLASDDEWSAPIMAEVGPDGNVWVIDWYNYIVQHNPTPPGYTTGRGNAYESDLRDKKHGRIYRVVYAGADAATPTNLESASIEQLVAALNHPTLLWRRHAQRLLIERHAVQAIPALIEMINDPAVDEIGLNVGAIHALWILHGLGGLSEAYPNALRAAMAALHHPSAGVRRNAVQVLPPTHETAAALLSAGILNDASAQVRLAGLLALTDVPASESIAQAVVELVGHVPTMSDRWLPDAATSLAAMNAIPFLQELANRGIVPFHDTTSKRDALTRIVAVHLARGSLSTEEIDAICQVLTRAAPTVTQEILAGLASGWTPDGKGDLTADSESLLLGLIEKLPVASQGDLIRLTGFLGSEKFTQHASQISTALLKSIGDAQQPSKGRIADANRLVQFLPSDDHVVEQLLALVIPQAPLEFSAGVIGALSQSLAPTLSEQLLERATEMTPSARSAAIDVLLRRPPTTLALLDAVEQNRIQVADLSLDQRQSLTNHLDSNIRKRATSVLEHSGGLPNPDRQKVIDSLHHVVEATGRVGPGKEVFKKHCAVCHAHSGEGARIGPDLTGMAVHTKHDLLTQILDPSRSVESNFRLYSVLTVEDQILSGMLASETRTSIELVDTKGERHSVQRDDIAKLISSMKSLMPEGFEKQIAEDELIDLLAFLTARGKFLPLPLDKAATVVTTQGMFFNRDAQFEQLVLPDWAPQQIEGIPFVLIDPQGRRVPNAIMLNAPFGTYAPRLPKAISIPCNTTATAFHFLGGVSGMGYPRSGKGTVSLIVRIHYADGESEEHELINGVHLADFTQHTDVAQSKLAIKIGGYQLRFLSVHPQRTAPVDRLELVKGPDGTAPLVLAITAERE